MGARTGRAAERPPVWGQVNFPLLCTPPPLPSVPRHSPAQPQRGQKQHHEDEEGVALVHRGPVLPGAMRVGRQQSTGRDQGRAAHPGTMSQEAPLDGGGPLGEGTGPRAGTLQGKGLAAQRQGW